MKNILTTITNEMNAVLSDVQENEVVELANKIASAKRIFIAGTGRSGLAAKMFAMRLMHSGYDVYVVGETITPSIAEDDLFILVSGSGSTKSLMMMAETAKSVGVEIALITTNRDSKIAQLSESVVVIPAATKKQLTKRSTIQPLGSQFDQAAHLLLDGIIVYLLNNDKKESAETLNKKHANLE